VLNDSSKKEDRIRTSSGRFIGKLQVIGGQVGRKPIEEKIFKDFLNTAWNPCIWQHWN